MSEERAHPTQNREWLDSISTRESRRRGALAMLHDQGKHHDADSCPRCEEDLPYQFTERPVAKSSTSTLKAPGCQRCGCRLDGKPLTRLCDCKCHRNGPRG